jgi:hypothetical protein
VEGARSDLGPYSDYRSWDALRGQAVIRQGQVVASIDRESSPYYLFDDLSHPMIDLFEPYLQHLTLAQSAENRLQDAIGIVRRLIEIMSDPRFTNSIDTPFSVCRNREQTARTRADLTALLDSMTEQVARLDFRGVLLEEADLKEGMVRNAELAVDLMTTLDLDHLLPNEGLAVRFAVLPSPAITIDDPNRAIIPVLHYTNADAASGKYEKEAHGYVDKVQWIIRYVLLTPSEVWQMRRMPDADQTALDIDFVMMRAGRHSYGLELNRASNHAR